MEKEKNDDYTRYEDYEVPKEFDKFQSDVNNMINPYNKNLYTWVIGILVLTIISISSGGVYLYKQNVDAKDAEIKRLLQDKDKDCKEELKKYLELQRELMKTMKSDEELSHERE